MLSMKSLNVLWHFNSSVMTEELKWTLAQVLAMVLFFPAYLQATTNPATPPQTRQPQSEVAQLVIYEEPLQFTIPPSCGDSVEFSFLLFSKGGDVKDLTVAPREAKTPEGNLLSAGAITAAAESNTATSTGIKITLTLLTSKFVQPGAYKVTLFFEGKVAGVQPVSKPVTITITQPTAAINLDDLKDRTFKITRPFPGLAASGAYRLILYEFYRKAAIRDLQGFGQGVFQNKTKIQTKGKVSVTPDRTPCLAVNDKLSLELTLSEFKQAGVYTSSILLNSPSFDKPIPIPVTVEVGDCWGLPLLVIFVGVGLGYWINYLKKSYKPRQENLLRLTKFRDMILRQASRTEDPGNLGKLYNMRRRLDEAEDKNSAGDFAGAKGSLEQVEKDLYDFLKEIFSEQVKTRRLVEDLISVIGEYQHKLLEPDSKELDALEIKPKLLAAEDHLAQGEVDLAKKFLEECQKKFDDFRKKMLIGEIQAKEKEIQDVAEAERTKFIPAVESIRNLINANQFEEARKQLDDLQEKIDQVKPAMGKGLSYRRLRIFKTRELEIITINNSLENRTSGSVISFSLKGTSPAYDYDLVNWNFGDGTGTFKGQGEMSHPFDASGVYKVDVQLMKDQKLVKQFSRLVEILPGKSEMSVKAIKKTIFFADFAISVAALLLASVTGVIYLYMGKPFGSLEDYLLALLWGFGIDNSVRGFTAVYGRITQ
jgi:hypothetical protein